MLKITEMLRHSGFRTLLKTYATSGLFLIILLSLATELGAQQYALVALAISIGSIAMIIVNCGSDIALIRRLVIDQSHKSQTTLIHSNLAFRLNIFAIVCVLLLIANTILLKNTSEILTVSILCIWVTMQGLAPNALFDYSRKVSSQQSLLILERILTLLPIVAMAAFDTNEYSLLFLGVTFVLVRIGILIYQYSKLQFVFRYKIIAKNLLSTKFTPQNCGTDPLLAFALTCNAAVSYGNQICLEIASKRADLAAYSISFQVFAIASIFQATALRLWNRDIAETSNRAPQFRDVARKAGRLSIISFLISFAMVAICAIVLELFRPNIDNSIFYKTATLLGLWITACGWGMVVTRHMLALNDNGFYSATAFLGGLATIGTGILLVPIFGAPGVAGILLVVHSTMILAYTIRLAGLLAHHTQS